MKSLKEGIHFLVKFTIIYLINFYVDDKKNSEISVFLTSFFMANFIACWNMDNF